MLTAPELRDYCQPEIIIQTARSTSARGTKKTLTLCQGHLPSAVLPLPPHTGNSWMFWRPRSRATRSCGHLSHCCEAILAEIYVTDRQHLCKGFYHPFIVPVRWNTNVMPKAGYYAVKVGKRPGIYTTWSTFHVLISERVVIDYYCNQGGLPRTGGRLSLRKV